MPSRKSVDSKRELSIEQEEPGLENEDDLPRIPKKVLRDSVVFSTDWTTEVLIQQLRKGNIDLDPAFQRRDAWTLRRKSLFIESLIVGLPVPQIVLAEKLDAKGQFFVIDGKQRLLSLLRFTQVFDEQAPFVLSNLNVRPDLNGYSYADLARKEDDLVAFENQTIRTVIIRNWAEEEMLYLIFHRINSETLPLSPQELRQALHPGPFLTYCDSHSRDSLALQKILRLRKPDFRMRDVELLVRFFAFRNFVSNYTGDLKGFLDDACKDLNKSWKKVKPKVEKQAEQFEAAVKASFDIFQDEPFRKWDGNSYERRFNRAIFDVIIYFFSDETIRRAAVDKSERVLDAYKYLCASDSSFVKAVETTTKSKAATATRFNHWAAALSTALNMSVKSPITNG